MASRPLPYRLAKKGLALIEIVAGIKQAIDLHAVARPFLDFVEVARKELDAWQRQLI